MPDIKNIYIIDKDKSVRRSFERLITSFNIEVNSFESTKSFAEQVTPELKACLLIDVDTIEDISNTKSLLAAFKDNFHTIATTANSDQKARKTALKINASMCLQKPIDAQALIDLIKWSESRKQTNIIPG